MNALVSILAVAALVVIALLGAGAGLDTVFGVILPYAAIVTFLVGFVYRIVKWARAPVPFRIPTVAGQQKSLDWLPHQRLESPATKGQVYLRMALEILFFRSLFRNTKAELKGGPRLVYSAEKSLWLMGLIFHWTFLFIFIRHLRFFTQPVPWLVTSLEGLDGFFTIGIPTFFMTDALLLLALTFLIGRRFLNPQVRYISLIADYFPLFLILGIALSGITLRHFIKTDVVGVKELGMGLISMSPPNLAELNLSGVFFIHLTLVTTLIAYFPFSKLMHLGGVFMSPTRNLANNNRAVRHVNPWKQDVPVHEFEHWEEEFKEEIAEAGYKLERD
jgi:[DsrC]-trisulfide reductase subunit M